MSGTRTAGDAEGDDQHEAHGKDNPAAEKHMSQDCINIGYNIFQEGLKYYAKIEGAQDALEWLWGYSVNKLGCSKMALCDATAMDWKQLHAVFTGAASESKALTEEVMQAVARLRKQAETTRERLVVTPITRRICETLDYCRDWKAMVTVKGPTGRSKTSTALWWAEENNHGRTSYIRMRSSCSRRMLVTAICQAKNIGVNGKKTIELEERLFKAFSPRNVLIIDEAGHLIPRCGQGTSAIEFIRDVHDICGCGIALIFTDVYLQEMRNGRLANYFEQFFGRIKFEMTIPQEVRKDEVLAVVKSFRKDPPEKLLALSVKLAREREGKLRTLFEDLQRAKEWADRQGHALGAEDLNLASNWRKNGSEYPDED